MKKNTKNIDNIWLKAAVVGGLWASLEIIIGSFLHNTRLPMAGTTLAFAGTILLLGYYQIWPERGLIIRAGLITAIMKSVSPSAVILGPMTGIMLEAALIELVIMLVGNNIFGYIIAGVLSISSALLHKIVSLLIYYGFDLIKVYLNVLNFALKQLGIAQMSPIDVLLILLLVYTALGVLAGLLVNYIGKKAIADRSTPNNFVLHKKINNRTDFFAVSPNKNPSIFMLVIHTLAIPFGLILLNIRETVFGFIFIVAYILFFGYLYRYAIRRLRKPVFWTQLILIVLLSALFWDVGNSSHGWFSVEGFYVGLEMMIRALFIVVAFSSVSVELKNEKVRNFLTKVGFGKYYQAIGLSFSALPLMISLLPTSKEIISHPVSSMLLPLTMADQWLELFKEKNIESPAHNEV